MENNDLKQYCVGLASFIVGKTTFNLIKIFPCNATDYPMQLASNELFMAIFDRINRAMPQIRHFLFTHRYKIAFCTLLVLVIVDRCLLLQHFTFRYVDDDQSIMWFGAKEFSEGGFHEPYFFGQPYNTLFESLIAVPFIKLGISYPVALTVMMSFVTLFPYFLISSLLFRRGKEIQSLFILSILLVLPNEFGMITAISRGCSVGIFFAGFALSQLFSSGKWRFFLFGFFAMLGMYANQNAAVILFPAGLLLLLENWKDKIFYIHNFIGGILPAVLWYFSVHFYKIHPENIVHESWPLRFNIYSMTISSIIGFFNDVVPVFWGMGWMIFILLLAFVFFLFKQKQSKSAIALIGGIALLLFSLGINKVHDGYSTVFYSWSRMFIGVPLLFAVFGSKIDLSKISNRILTFLWLIPISFFILKCSIVSKCVDREIHVKKERNMFVSEISELKNSCQKIQSVSKEFKVDLIVIGNEDHKQLFNYACPCLLDSFPQTIEPDRDRRTWVLQEEEGKVRTNILFVAVFEDLFAEQLKLNGEIINVSADPPMYLLKNNNLKTGELLRTLNLPMRPH